MTNLAEIGRFLRQARKERAMTASELALKAGVSRNTLGALEAGRGNVELNTLLALLRTLELEMQFVPQAVAALTRGDIDTRFTGLQEEVDSLMPRSRRSPQARPIR
ncbi:helix-turn-helix domain-containing protein [Variovorax sp. J22P240]|uniref:helix-turn-helix transcriptional regulator n=1 Tax=Variovorax sp. J22P240 TaxID=3053514 RepID=UPI0025771190|nr:helix-turn-helix domain-containing protein [Variovorax sp. J22P240]MDL9997622.1 helix-turn-helix domain-containing protein [Variovorax sp. J22P240]